ncbi:carbonic anhydrase 2 [Tetranychus urticae]|uniref:Carbonic anhydrase n=1 Tax=Tetranychus urticae TaxID=32264 RepID=T1KUV6_TETUR|nr:carbonic anhydrase 2 [Tetranychus urticae]
MFLILSTLLLPTLISTINGEIGSQFGESHTIVKRATKPDHFTYTDQKEWLTFNGSQCGNDRQSPINLDSSLATIDESLHLNFNSYDNLLEAGQGSVHSTGHNLRLDFKTQYTYSVTGSAVEGHLMELYQLHLHWGINSMSGSEHAIDGERFAAEVHFVHLNAAYKGFGEKALEHEDALTVIGVIAKNGDPNPGLDILLEAMQSNSSNIKYDTKNQFSLRYFLPGNTKSFFKYFGSLTTPNCQEAVNWIVMKDFITVSNDQIDRLRSLVDEHGDEMKTVVRDVQPLKGRTIYQSDSGSMLGPISLASIVFYLIIHILFIQKCILN